MMNLALPIEARSLSSITTLASNPPTYPRNPTHEVHEPLVLYIVRVPGSKDVFLTPLKPPTKDTISADAILTCLYYLHVSGPEDQAVRDSIEQQRRSGEIERATPSAAVHRKPLPNAPFSNETPADRPPLPLKSYPHFQPASPTAGGDTQQARLAARGTHVRLNSTSVSGGTIHRKPLGPRPLHSKLQSLDTNVIERKPVGSEEKDAYGRPRRRTNPTPTSATNSYGGWRELNLETNGGQTSTERKEYRDLRAPRPVHAAQPPLSARPGQDPSASQSSNDFYITIIRRDPASGGQWNIGSISSNNLVDQTSVSVEIATPGYQRFARNKPLEVPANFDITTLGKRNNDTFPRTSRYDF